MTDKLYRVKWTNEDASGYFIDKHPHRVAQDLANALNELGTPTVYTVEAVPRTPGRPQGSKNKPGHSAGRPPLSKDEPTERHMILMPASWWRYIENLENGNRSAGVRLAVEEAMRK